MSCDIGEATEGLESFLTSPTSQLILILQAFRHFTYVTDHSHSPSFPSLHLRHRSFSNPSLALPTSQLILQSFRCFTYVTAHSATLLSFLLRHRIFTYVTRRDAHGQSFPDSQESPKAIIYNLVRNFVQGSVLDKKRTCVKPVLSEEMLYETGHRLETNFTKLSHRVAQQAGVSQCSVISSTKLLYISSGDA